MHLEAEENGCLQPTDAELQCRAVAYEISNQGSVPESRRVRYFRRQRWNLRRLLESKLTIVPVDTERTLRVWQVRIHVGDSEGGFLPHRRQEILAWSETAVPLRIRRRDLCDDRVHANVFLQ